MSLTKKRKSDVRGLTPVSQGEVLITRSVGKKGTNNEHDVQMVERLLGDAGLLDPVRASDPPGRADSQLTTAIREFQKMAGLKTDGFLEPSGPTIRALGTMGTLPKFLGAGDTSRVEPETVSANGRLISVLRNTTDLGPLPNYIAEAANDGGTGRAGVIDLFRQIRADAPDVSPRLHKALQPILDARLHRVLYAEAAVPTDSEQKPPREPDDPGGDVPDKPDETGQPDGPGKPGKPNDPGQPDEPDQPDDPSEPDKPDDPDDDDEDEGKEKRCEELARQYRAEALANFKAAQKSWGKADKKYEESLKGLKSAKQEFYTAAMDFALDWALPQSKVVSAVKAGWKMIRHEETGKVISLPSDLFRAWARVYDVDDLQKQLLKIRDEFENKMNKYREEMNRLYAEMQALGCQQAKS